MYKTAFCTAIFLLLGTSGASVVADDRELISWQTKKLSSDFFGEGAYFGDFNNDGAMDVVSGPLWYEGPDFVKQHEYRPVKKYDPKG